MGNYLLATVYVTPSDKKMYELLEVDKSDFLNYSIVFMNQDEMQMKFYEEGNTFDFTLHGGFVLWDGPLVTVDEETMAGMNNRSFVIRSVIDTVYHHLVNLMEVKAWYLDGIESLDEVVAEESSAMAINTKLARMNSLKISSSTMRVYISILTDDGWRNRSIIEIKEHLQFNPFYFVIEESDESSMIKSEFILEHSRFSKGGIDYIVYYFTNGIPIYPHFSPSFKLIDPLINKNMASILNHQTTAGLLEYYRKALVREVNRISGEEPEEVTKMTTFTEYHVTNKNGVFFKYSEKINTRNYIVLTETAHLIARSVKETGRSNSPELVSKIRALKLPPHEWQATMALATILLSKDATIDIRLARANSAKNESLRESARIELELFAIRAYIFLTGFRIPGLDKYIMRGGDSKGHTTLSKVGGD